MKVYISPNFTGPDQGDGGIRRVVEAQYKYLPDQGIEVVASEKDADLVAIHAGSYVATNKPVVAHNHGLYWSEYPWPSWAHEMNNACINVLRRADAVTAPSDWVANIIRRGMGINALTVYHGVDAAEWAPAADAKAHPYVLWNKTRVDPICDPTPVTELAKRLHNVAFVTTYGDADLRNVRVTGRVPYEQGKRLVQGATVYLATARETFGIGTLEAMAAGAVVVGFDWGGQAEIVNNNVDGILVRPNDYEALAHAVGRALEKPDEYRVAGYKTASLYTWQAACEQYATVYERALEQMSGPRTSVIVTCYNLAGTLERAVKSVLNQDDHDVEVVIVNDASPDDTGVVAGRLETESPGRVRVVTNPSNLYLAGSLDAGVRASSGRYVMALDADNELAPGSLRTLADALDTDQDVDIAYGSMTVVQEWPGGITFQSRWPAQFNYQQQMAHRNQIPSTSLYRKKWHDRAGGYRRRCRTAEDADFWCRTTSAGAQPRKVTEQTTLIYHERKESMSHVEADWPWENWYTWGRIPGLTPWGVKVAGNRRVPTLEPATVTVVIPVGPGHDRYLPDALDSLLAQTFQNWRCIVVDDRPLPSDGMTIPPWALYLSTSAPFGRGPAAARNLGLAYTRTPYVLFLDADDYLAPGALEVMVGAAVDRHNPYEYYYSDWIKQEESKVYQAPDFNAEHLRTNLTHSVTAMYPTAACKHIDGFDEDLDAWEDWDFVIRLILDGGICGVHLPFPLLYYRYHTGQRREELYKDRDRHSAIMRKKHYNLMVEKAPMACGCSGGRTTYSPPVKVGNVPVPVTQDGMTLVEYSGTSAPRTYRGASGREYRFGRDEGHRAHYVLNTDLVTFINRLDFRLAIADSDGMAVLQALGPPNREAELAVV